MTSTKIRPQDHVRAMSEPEGAVLLDLRRGKYFSTNSVGAAIWQQLVQGAGRDRILDHLRGSFEAPEARLEQDVNNFLTMLAEKGLIDADA